MKLGTHNSMTYLPPKKWYLYPFRFMARCQSVDIERQYELGARMFDLRIKFDKSGIPEFRHGSMAVKGKVDQVLDYLNSKGAYVRLLLETHKRDAVQEQRFIDFCKTAEQYWSNITFFCGRAKYNWKQLYKFEADDIDVIQKVSSMTGTIIDDWCPWFYAKLFNRSNIKNHNTDDWLLVDFINIQ